MKSLIQAAVVAGSLVLLAGCRMGGDITATPAASAAPVPYVPIPTIAIPSTSPYYSRGSILTITGLCAQGSLVQLTGDSTISTICTASTYSFQIPRTLDGIYSFVVFQRDANLNPSSSVAQVWVRKTSIARPSILLPVSTTFASALPLLPITGNCETNATVSLGGDASGSQPCANATFSFNVPKAADGDYNIVVNQTDPAGNSANTSVIWKRHIISSLPSAVQVKAGESISLQLSGGSESYTVSLGSNPSGSPFVTQGANALIPFSYTAGGVANVTDVLHVVDSLGTTYDIPVTVKPNTADHFNIVDGNLQTTVVGRVQTTSPKVRIVDVYGNGVPSQKVRFQVTNGDAKISGPRLATSDANGLVSVTLKMGISHLQNTISVNAVAAVLPDVNHTGRAKLTLIENSSVLANNSSRFGLSFPTVNYPGLIVSANFGGAHTDTKHMDLAVLNIGGTATISILKNIGGGMYSSSIIPTCSGPTGLATGDFNGDGLVDLVVACNSGVVAVHKGNLDGSFQSPISTNTLSGPVGIVAGDFRNSGRADLAIVYSSGSVAIQTGNGDGTFAAPNVLSNQRTFNPVALRMADFNNDGYPDLVVLNGAPDNAISTLRNMADHTATFQPNVDLPTGGSPSDIVIGDFNSDGYPDVAVSNAADSDVGIYLTNSISKNLTAMQAQAVGSVPTLLAAGDFASSGYARDLAVLNSTNQNVGILPNLTVPGTMSVAFDTMQTEAFTDVPMSLLFAETNGDTKADLIAGIPGSPSVIQVRQGKGNFKFGNDVATGGGPTAVVAGSFFTGGTTTDLAVVNSTGNTLSIFKGLGNGQFALVNTYATGTSPKAVAAADFNDDGVTDLVVLNKGSKTVAVYFGNGDGTFQAPTTTALANGPSALVVKDFNHDSRPDIAVANTLSNSVSILLNDGVGGFATKVDYSTGLGPIDVRAGDLNTDGQIDLVVANSGDDTFGVLLGVGDGTFRSIVNYQAGSQPTVLQLIDFNGDLIPDLGILNSGDGSISIFRGVGDGSFVARSTITTTSGSARDIASGDFHGLGHVDLATPNEDNSITIYPGRGDGTFGTPTTFVSYRDTATFTSLISTDFNGDGVIDFIALDAANAVFETWAGQ